MSHHKDELRDDKTCDDKTCDDKSRDPQLDILPDFSDSPAAASKRRGERDDDQTASDALAGDEVDGDEVDGDEVGLAHVNAGEVDAGELNSEREWQPVEEAGNSLFDSSATTEFARRHLTLPEPRAEFEHRMSALFRESRKEPTVEIEKTKPGTEAARFNPRPKKRGETSALLTFEMGAFGVSLVASLMLGLILGWMLFADDDGAANDSNRTGKRPETMIADLEGQGLRNSVQFKSERETFVVNDQVQMSADGPVRRVETLTMRLVEFPQPGTDQDSNPVEVPIRKIIVTPAGPI